MSRFTQYDEDEYRLPEGMRRVGYDADTQRYTFRDSDDSYWEGPAGARYGELRPAGTWDQVTLAEAAAADVAIEGQQKQAWRMLAPFMLLVGVVLLALFYWLSIGPWSASTAPRYDAAPQPASGPDHGRVPGAQGVGQGQDGACPDHARVHTVRKGETCWAIAQGYHISLEALRDDNVGLDCDALRIGSRVCVGKAE